MTVKGLDAWLNRLNSSDLPVLGSVVASLNQLTESDQTHVNQLSDVILKDSNLTSQLLRVANSAHFNPGGSNINTVTRAIVQVGFEGVKNICISLMLVDQLLSAHPRERLLRAMALAFHAALQARALVPPLDEDTCEKVFIAALLHNVGEMAVWSKGEAQADALDALMLQGVAEREACEQVLSFQFSTLSKALVQQWHLSDILAACLQGNARSPLVSAVQLGEALSRAVEYGWESKATESVLEKIARFRRVSIERAREDAMATAEQASKVVALFGVPALTRLLPGQAEAPQIAVGKPDDQAQMRALKQLSSAVRQGADISKVFQLVTDGLHQGATFARVAVLLRMQDKLAARFCAGRSEAMWRQKFQLNAGDVHFFSEALVYQAPQLFDVERISKCQHLFTEPVQNLVGAVPCMVAPVLLNGRTAGLFYADNDGADIPDGQRESFELFVHQAQLSLQAASLAIRAQPSR